MQTRVSRFNRNIYKDREEKQKYSGVAGFLLNQTKLVRMRHEEQIRFDLKPITKSSKRNRNSPSEVEN